MKSKCDGCGVKIQTTDPQKSGYIRSEVYYKNPDNFLCERCFQLTHYNNNVEVEFEDGSFYKNIQLISQSEGLVVYIVDLFDLEGTYIKNIRTYFPNNKIILVANKFDLYLNSVRFGKIYHYLIEKLRQDAIHVNDLLVISSFRNNDVDRLIRSIVEHQHQKDVYFFGMTNVGKSSLLNAIIRKQIKNVSQITVSNMVSTTLGLIKIPLGNKTYILDTPGIINKDQITYYVDKDTMNIITPKTYIKPKTYQLNPKQALFVGGFAIVEFIEGERSSFTMNFSNELVIHRTKLENAKEFYQKHLEDLLIIPSAGELERLGPMIPHAFKITEDEKMDVAISGLGFVSIRGNANIRVLAPEKIRVFLRPSIV